jgi:NACHT domain
MLTTATTGNPGCGKTVLAASTLEAFKNDERFQDTNTCYYFFHTESRSTAPEPALRAILSQVLHKNRHNEALVDMFVLAMDTNTEGQKNASVSDLRDMFGLCWANVGNYYILLDGLDEVVTLASDNMLESALVQTRSYRNVKILMLSRPAGLVVNWISQLVLDDRRFDIGDSNTNDIQLYLSRQIACLLDTNLLSKNDNPQQLVGHLVTGANGMFLWARLMCKLLNSRMFSPAQRTDLIMTVTLPEELSSMYERIFRLILQMPAIESNLAKDVLQWLTFSRYMLNAREIWQALTSTEAKYKPPGDPATDDIGGFRERVLMVCASLVEFRERSVDSEEGSFHLIHLSIKEYIIQSATEYDQPYSRQPQGASLFRKSQCHADITRSCLYFLTYLPRQPLGKSLGKNVKRGDLSKAFPFCKYAVQNWHIHFCKAFESTECPLDIDGQHNYTQDTSRLKTQWHILTAVQEYLSQKFALMAWIEASYVFGFRGIRLETNFGDWLLLNVNAPCRCNLKQLGSDYLEFGGYLKQLDIEWGTQLDQNPACIWEEATAFTPSRFLAQTTAFTVNSLTATHTRDEKSSNQPLCKISGMSSDELYIGVLSIWPSRYECSHLIVDS